MNVFYIARESWEDCYSKNRAHPQWVHILNKEYYNLMRKYNPDYVPRHRNDLSSIQKRLFSDFQFEFKGKMDYKGAQDYMDVWPKFRGCFGVINEKIKRIFEELNISKEEYILHPIELKGCNDNYYLMFIFQIPITKIIMTSSIYCCGFQHDINYRPATIDQYYDGDYKSIIPKHLTISNEFSEYDILRVDSCSYTFFSERLVRELKKNNVIGLEYCTLGFRKFDAIPTLSFE